MISYKNVWYHVWYHSSAFLALLWYCEKCMISCMISYFFMMSYMISQSHWFFRLSCAIFLWYCLRYHIHIIQNVLWYQNYMILNMILAMICPPDISITWYHSHTISRILWCYSLYHGTCAAGSWWPGQWPGAPTCPASAQALQQAHSTVEFSSLLEM